ncbi:hypothetical protein EDD21DRAFT_378171 [Dissophora ornata]|nr:Dicer-like protein 1 [Dissophora ornata]KAI8600067.1 hypothetical protein EDD21DRAFT_378171 [Dissophora ornata]
MRPDNDEGDLLVFEDEPFLPAVVTAPFSYSKVPDLLSSSCQGLPLLPAALTPAVNAFPHRTASPPVVATPSSNARTGVNTSSPTTSFATSNAATSARPQPRASDTLIDTPVSSTAAHLSEVVVPEVARDPFLVPRQYQLELFRKALKSNIIAVMDTGSGKTLVAVMLIREMMQREQDAQRSPAERKICFFVVNNVPLVMQQASVIRANSAAEVIGLCGPKEANNLSQDLWAYVLDEVDVVVLTAQILLDVLLHGFLTMSKIHLLIFDECHHTRKNHPFCRIMKERYYTTPDHERPKIFGMTASPSLESGSRMESSAKELESLMDAKVYTVDQGQVLAFIERPREFIIQFHPSPQYQTTILTHRLREQCSMVDRLELLFTSAADVLQHLGPWCINRLWQLQVEKLVEVKDNGPLSAATMVAANIVKAMPLPPPKYSEAYLSPKVLKLIQLLRVAAVGLDDDFCGIVFVKRRDTAIALCLLLQEIEEFRGIFRVQILAGHNNESEKVMRMSYRDQTAIISHFRNKTYNLLVATSVAEEGLDIQPCNFVIRFDPATSIISYIQSRGRARKSDSRYITMQELDNRTEEATFEKIKRAEATMKEWCHNLDEDRVMRNPVDGDDDSALEKLMPSQTYSVASTGALLTLDSAIAIVHYYCSTLAGDEFCSLRPDFNVMSNGSSGFICDLTLPPNAPIRLVQSDRTSTKSMAKKSAAFKACEKLHTLGALNDNLLPIIPDRPKDEGTGEIRALDVKGENKSYPVASPKFWAQVPRRPGEDVSLFGCVIELASKDLELLGGKERYRTICLLTHRPLPCDIPPFNLYVDGARRLMTLRRIPMPVVVDEERLILLQQFTLMIFQRMCRKTFECLLEDTPYFVAPLALNYCAPQSLQTGISWNDVLLGQSPDPLPILDEEKTEQSIRKAVLTLRYDHGRDFFVKGIMREFRMCDIMPQDRFKNELAAWDAAIAKGKAKDEQGSGGTPGNSSRTFASYFKWKYVGDFGDDDIILSVDRVRKMRNHLQEAVRSEDQPDERSTTIVPIGVCMRCSVLSDVLRASQLIPSVLQSLDSTLLVQEVREKVGLLEVHLDYLQEAFTTSSANRDFQYERLELLGDSFLKFTSTIRLYIVNPSKDEGHLHANRIRVISNKALLGHSTKLELYRYVSSTPFPRKSWRPTRFIVGKDPWKEGKSHELSNKTLADIVESSLGAAYLSGGVTTGFLAAKALLIPFDEFANWDDFCRVYYRDKAAKESLDGRSTLVLRPSHLSGVREIGELFGYKFKDPLLFLEAMTHASHIRSDAICYQRLEFLGDAVLDFQVIQYYYEKYHNASPGVITLIKDASVNNSILGALSIKWGLYKYLNHFSPTLIGAISRAVTALEEKKDKSPTNTLDGEYWHDVAMPKVLGDLVESTLGAIFVDSGFDFEVISGVFKRMMRPFLDEHVNFESINIHPTKRLLELLQSQGCCKFGFETDNAVQSSIGTKLLRRLGLGVRSTHNHQTPQQQNAEEGNVIMRCDFKIHDKVMATATGDHVEDMRKQVAIETMVLLKDDPQLLGGLCTCPKRRRPQHMSVLDRYMQ